MSQAGVINIENANPQIPTDFITNDGDAVPIGNQLELLAAIVPAGSIPFETVGSGNTVTTNLQLSQAIASTDANSVGVASFNSADFTVDANGFVSAIGGSGTVTSVSGTPNRITISGTAEDPIVDIASTYVGQTSINTLGTVSTGIWQADVIDEIYGGTGQSSYITGDILYASAANTLSKLAVGSNTEVLTLAGGVPTWAAPTTGTVESVSGTADRITISGTAVDPVVDIASTYVGQTSITTLGTVATGTWEATDVGLGHGGTGASLSDPGADRILFWDDTASAVTWLEAGTGLTITGTTMTAEGSGGDVVGTPPSTDTAIARYDGTSGLLIENSLVTISDIGVVDGATQLNVDNLRLDGNTISSTDTNGDIDIAPDGTGDINLLPDGGGIVDQSYASVGGTVRYRMHNTDDTGAAQSDCQHTVQVQDDSIGDPFYSAIISQTHAWSWGIDQSDSNSYRIEYEAGTSNPTFSSGAKVLDITPAGEMTLPLQPAFAAFLGSSDANVTGNGTTFILGDTDVGTALTEIFDQGGDFVTGSASGATFTAPVTGRYSFSSSFYIQGIVAADSIDYTILTSNRTWRSYSVSPSAVMTSGNNAGITMNILCDMDAGDTAVTRINISGETGDINDVFGGATNPRTWFSGHLVC